MLPIYKAKVFESRIEKGGRTRPLVVTVRDNEGHLKQFVVKLYSKSDVQENKALGKEVLLIPLIEEFDLLTPSPALIRFDQGFINTLPRELQTEVIEKGAYLNFGCEYLDGSLNFNETIPQSTLDELDNVDTIFAFDVLLRNLDRRLTKPNLLMQERSIYLI
ncbi:MAG: HipA family kinase [Spirosomataceae bacterium]